MGEIKGTGVAKGDLEPKCKKRKKPPEGGLRTYPSAWDKADESVINEGGTSPYQAAGWSETER